MLWIILGLRSKMLKIIEVKYIILRPRSKILWITLGLRSKLIKTTLLYSY
jgi:hypothetical protein